MMKARSWALLLSMLSTIPAFAVSMDTFTLTSAIDTITFTVPSAPISPGGLSYFFVLNNVPVTINGIVDNTYITFYVGNGYNQGGLLIQDRTTNQEIIEQAEYALFTGPTSSPVFLVGNFPSDAFIGSQGPVGVYSENFDIVIAQQTATTPEPSSLVFLGTALAGLFRFRRTLARLS